MTLSYPFNRQFTIGESVVSSLKASDYIRPIEDGEAELPFEDKTK